MLQNLDGEEFNENFEKMLDAELQCAYLIDSDNPGDLAKAQLKGENILITVVDDEGTITGFFNLVEGADKPGATKYTDLNTGSNKLLFADLAQVISKYQVAVNEVEADNPEDKNSGTNGRYLKLKNLDGGSQQFYFHILDQSKPSNVLMPQLKDSQRQVLYIAENPDFQSDRPNLVGQNIDDVMAYNLSAERYHQLNKNTLYLAGPYDDRISTYQKNLRLQNKTSTSYRNCISDYILRKRVPLNKYYNMGH